MLFKTTLAAAAALANARPIEPVEITLRPARAAGISAASAPALSRAAAPMARLAASVGATP